MTNHELATLVNTTDEWIRTRTGILERRIADIKESTSTMAIQAARAALDVAGLDPERLDLIITCTVTGDYPFPATASLVQDALGASHAGAFDLAAGCAGFIYGLSVASQMIIAGACDNILVIGAETLSRIMDWTDRQTCVLFGDGAGAFVLQASDQPGGVLSFTLGSDGSGADLLMMPAGGSRHPFDEAALSNGLTKIRMNGREVFRFATRIMGKAAKDAIDQAGLDIDDIELFVPHQANLRIIETAARFLNLPMERVFVNLDRYGNTSAASVPIAVCEAVEQGRIQPGDHVVLVGFGAGLSWAAALIQWAVPPVRRWPWWRRLLQWLRYRYAVVKSIAHRVERKLDIFWNRLLGRNGDLENETAQRPPEKGAEEPQPAPVEPSNQDS